MQVDDIKKTYYRALGPLARALARLHIAPVVLTLAGLSLSVVSAALFWHGRFRWAGVVLLAGGVCDSLDGEVARAGNNVSRFGAFFDSTVDRFSEVAVTGGLALYFLRQGNTPAVAALFLLLAAALLVSYIRARAEGVGQNCTVGLLQRPGRVVLLALGALGGVYGIIITVWVAALLSVITVLQRFFYVCRSLRSS